MAESLDEVICSIDRALARDGLHDGQEHFKADPLIWNTKSVNTTCHKTYLHREKIKSISVLPTHHCHTQDVYHETSYLRIITTFVSSKWWLTDASQDQVKPFSGTIPDFRASLHYYYAEMFKWCKVNCGWRAYFQICFWKYKKLEKTSMYQKGKCGNCRYQESRTILGSSVSSSNQGNMRMTHGADPGNLVMYLGH